MSIFCFKKITQKLAVKVMEMVKNHKNGQNAPLWGPVMLSSKLGPKKGLTFSPQPGPNWKVNGLRTPFYDGARWSKEFKVGKNWVKMGFLTTTNTPWLFSATIWLCNYELFAGRTWDDRVVAIGGIMNRESYDLRPGRHNPYLLSPHYALSPSTFIG